MQTPVNVYGKVEIDTSEADRLFRIVSGGDMLEHKIFKNIRDATIGLGTFEAIKKSLRHNGQRIKDSAGGPLTVCFVIGDGNYPRTSGTIAFRTNWSVVSIMPRYVLNERHKDIKNLIIHHINEKDRAAQISRIVSKSVKIAEESGVTRIIVVSTDGKQAAMKILRPMLEAINPVFEYIIVFAPEEMAGIYSDIERVEALRFGNYKLVHVDEQCSHGMWQNTQEFNVWSVTRKDD